MRKEYEMNCFAWRIPEGCYQYALTRQGCPSALWFWLAAVVVGGAVLLGGKR